MANFEKIDIYGIKEARLDQKDPEIWPMLELRRHTGCLKKRYLGFFGP